MDLFDFKPNERQVGAWLISRDIPVSGDQQHRQRVKWERPDFPFAHLDVGESFRFDPPPGMALIVAQNLVSGAAATFRNKDPHKRRFTTRQRGDHIRCWRVATTEPGGLPAH